VAILNRGDVKTLIYSDTIDLVEPSSVAVAKEDIQPKLAVSLEGVAAEGIGDSRSESDDDDESNDGGSGSESSEVGEGHAEHKPRGHRHEDRDAKKASSPFSSKMLCSAC